LVVFTSRARHLVAGDTSRSQDVFVRNRVTGRTLRVSVADDESEAAGWSADPIISADGRFVVFSSEATNLLPGHADRNGHIDDVYVRDRLRGRTRLVSRNQHGAQGTDLSFPLDVSANGRYILFTTTSKNFKPLRGLSSIDGAIYLRDMHRRRTYWIPGTVNSNGVLGAGSPTTVASSPTP
jgi:Tol biopolymer transport system component